MNSPASALSRLFKPQSLGVGLRCAGLGLVLVLVLAGGARATDSPSPISPARRTELITLVRQDCGSCHGLTLKGGLGPALLPTHLEDKPESYLKTVILHGVPDTAMPPWQRFLSEAEADWIVSHLKKGFPGER